MNLFLLDTMPYDAALYHTDAHVRKQTDIYAQMLAAAHVICDGLPTARMNVPVANVNRQTIGHPWTVWVASSSSNYEWTHALLREMMYQHVQRFKQPHSVYKYVDLLTKKPLLLSVGERTPFPQYMPKEYIIEGDPVAAYRRYYYSDKHRDAQWSRPAGEPEWWRVLEGVVRAKVAVS